jgi:hypothetical protein
VDEGSASVDYLFSPLQGARFAVEPLPALAWSECPACRGIGARISAEYSEDEQRFRFLQKFVVVSKALMIADMIECLETGDE